MNWLGSLILVWLCVQAGAAEPAYAPVQGRSSSGQFLVLGPPVNGTASAAAPAGKISLNGMSVDAKIIVQDNAPAPVGKIRLDPSLLAVSSERIKQAILQELAVSDQWKGQITLASQFMIGAANRPVDIRSYYGPPLGRLATPKQGKTGEWRFRVDFPDQIETNKFIRAVTGVILLEMANREAGEHLAEVPLWLAEGMTSQILAAANEELILKPFVQSVRVQDRRDVLEGARYWLQNHKAYTFSDLGMPAPEMLEGEPWVNYRICSHLLVVELLRLPGGPERMRNFLRLLPRYLNWQLAFLEAYKPFFTSLLEAEKWWALRQAQLEGRELWFGWSKPALWNRWDEILSVSVLVSDASNRLPAGQWISLPRALELYDFPVQKDLINDRLRQLSFLRAQGSPKTQPLIDAYIQTLQEYLSRRQEAGWEPAIKGTATPRPQMLIEATTKKLEALDKRRQSLRDEFLPRPVDKVPPQSEPAKNELRAIGR